MESSLFIGKIAGIGLAASASLFIRGDKIKPVSPPSHQRISTPLRKASEAKVNLKKNNISASLDPAGEASYFAKSTKDIKFMEARGIDVSSFKSQVKDTRKPQKQKPTKLSINQKEILYGILLGDASLQTENGGKTYRLRFTQGEQNKAYLFHIYEHFKEFTLTEPKFNSTNKTWYFNTRQDVTFRFYGKLFYDEKGVKRVPRYISKWLSLRSIAYWYCDDGSAKDKKTSPAFRFCTDSFSKQDVDLLVKALQDRYQVNAKIFENRPNQYRIYIGASDTSKISSKGVPLKIRDKEFANQFLPYIISEMYYKIPPKWFSEASLDMHNSVMQSKVTDSLSKD